MEWLEARMQLVVAAGMNRCNHHASHSRETMAVPKGLGFRLVSDYRAGNIWMELVPCLTLDLEVMPSWFSRVFCSMDLLQGYWKMPLTEGTQD